jgi:cytochrome c biogenesis protein ResB
MNNPLRYGGLTFYQASFANDDKTTILQVVRNPNWVLPYIACTLVSLGLLVQFTSHLMKFNKRRSAA